MRRSAPLSAALALLLAPLPAAAEHVTLVRDIGQRVPPPLEFEHGMFLPLSVELDGAVYFVHDDGIHGRELWRSDGSAAGTRMVRDVCPGSCGIESWRSFANLAVFGGLVLFAADDGVHGCELWRSDGTAAGTQLVADVLPGLAGSAPSSLVAADAELFFAADDGVHGRELWRSDGTAAGTSLVTDLAPGAAHGAPDTLAALGDKLVFGFESGGLWVSDGTAAGTEEISPVGVFYQSVTRGAPFLVLPSGLLVFQGWDAANGSELWRSDGTPAGTFLLADLYPGGGSSQPTAFQVVGAEVFFEASGPGFERHLWRSDGEQTVQVLLPAGVSPRSSFGTQAAVGGRYFFAASDLATGREPWVVEEGVASPVADVRPGPDSSLSPWPYGQLFAAAGEHLVFSADDGIHGLEPWTSDGTAAGTHLLAELAPGGASARFELLEGRAAAAHLDGELLFRDASTDFGRRLWRSDGTAAGTALVATLTSQTSAFRPDTDGRFVWAVPPENCLATVRGQLLFAADDGLTGVEPWISGGSEATTAQLADLEPQQGELHYGWSFPSACGSVGGRGVFQVTGVNSGLWGTAGIPGDPELLAAGGAGFSSRTAPARFADDLFTLIAAPDDSQQLVRTDGTPGGTTAIGPVAACGVGELVPAGNLLFVSDCGLSVSDGTPGSLAPLPTQQPAGAAAVGATLLFTASAPGAGSELWRSDGTPGGTWQVAEVQPGPGHGIPWIQEELGPITAAMGRLYFFTGDDGTLGEEPWVSDGSPGGTYQLADLVPGPSSSSPRELVAFGERVYFVAEAPGIGRELWSSTGKLGGTSLVADLAPGPSSSLPQELTVADGSLYFTAWDPLFGREPYRIASPGMAPQRLADIAPGARSSSPIRFHAVGGHVFMLANDNVRGFELWRLSEDGLIFRDGFASGDAEHWSAAVGP